MSRACCPKLLHPGPCRPPPTVLSVCVPVTNINDGLLRGISMLKEAREKHSVLDRSTSIVIMLTDGDANVGEAGAVLIQRRSSWLPLWAL